MNRLGYLAASALLLLAPSLALAGEAPFSDGEIVPVIGWVGGINPLAKGALYNTPLSVSYAYGYGSRRHYRHGRVLRVRY